MTKIIHTVLVALLLCIGLAGFVVAKTTEPDGHPPNKKAAPSPLSVYRDAKACLKLADQEINDARIESANQLLLRGLSLIGYEYLTDDVFDDTGMHLLAADAQERAGEFKSAVNLRRTVLSERLALFSTKFNLN
jgi:hypothetical protein